MDTQELINCLKQQIEEGTKQLAISFKTTVSPSLASVESLEELCNAIVALRAYIAALQAQLAKLEAQKEIM